MDVIVIYMSDEILQKYTILLDRKLLLTMGEGARTYIINTIRGSMLCYYEMVCDKEKYERVKMISLNIDGDVDLESVERIDISSSTLEDIETYKKEENNSSNNVENAVILHREKCTDAFMDFSQLNEYSKFIAYICNEYNFILNTQMLGVFEKKFIEERRKVENDFNPELQQKLFDNNVYIDINVVITYILNLDEIHKEGSISFEMIENIVGTTITPWCEETAKIFKSEDNTEGNIFDGVINGVQSFGNALRVEGDPMNSLRDFINSDGVTSLIETLKSNAPIISEGASHIASVVEKIPKYATIIAKDKIEKFHEGGINIIFEQVEACILPEKKEIWDMFTKEVGKRRILLPSAD